MQIFRTIRAVAVSVIAAGLLISCAAQEPYHWGEYETALYGYYENSENLENLMKALDAAIVEGEKLEKSEPTTKGAKQRRLPPGLYAEYGYLLMLKGDPKAKSYFEKEKQTWPESGTLMDKMIKFIEQDKDRRGKLSQVQTGGSAK